MITKRWFVQVCIGLLGSAFAVSSFGMAVTNRWTGNGGDKNWFTAANWTNNLGQTIVPDDGAHVVIDGTGSAGVWLTNSTATLASLLITNNMVTCSGWMTALRADAVTVADQGKIALPAPFGETGPSNRIWIVCGDLFIVASGAIDANTNGWAEGCGTGHGTANVTGGRAGGGSYGGLGGYTDNSTYYGSPGPVYGSTNAPTYPGSGGGVKVGSSPQAGDGGGAVRIEASGSVTVKGSITANGGNHKQTYEGAGGSGGAIFISCKSFGGSGALRANGGIGQNTGTRRYGGGGGGRIAVWVAVPDSLHDEVASGDTRRVDVASIWPTFEGSVTVAGGAGYVNTDPGVEPPRTPAEAGTKVFISGRSPARTIIVIR